MGTCNLNDTSATLNKTITNNIEKQHKYSNGGDMKQKHCVVAISVRLQAIMITNNARVLQWCSTKEGNSDGISDKEHEGAFPECAMTTLMKAAAFNKRLEKFPPIHSPE